MALKDRLKKLEQVSSPEVLHIAIIRFTPPPDGQALPEPLMVGNTLLSYVCGWKAPPA